MPLFHCSFTLSFEVCYEKSCMQLITAIHLFTGRVRLRKKEYLCVQCGTPQAPHCLLNSPESYFAVRFSGELFNSLFPPQVNKGCLPQEDDMKYLPTSFRFFFSQKQRSSSPCKIILLKEKILLQYMCSSRLVFSLPGLTNLYVCMWNFSVG